MASKRRTLNGLIIGAIVILILLLGATAVIQWAQHSRNQLPVLGTVPSFEMTNHRGETFGREDLMGKISIVDFIFTNCQSACPVMSARMEELYHFYAHTDQVQFVSISVDPERDTQEQLQHYAREHGVTDRRWIFLRAPVAEVVDLSEKGFYLPAENLPMGHSTKFVLVDKSAQIRAYHDAMDINSLDLLKSDIKKLAE
jgi:protein SCO1/2